MFYTAKVVSIGKIKQAHTADMSLNLGRPTAELHNVMSNINPRQYQTLIQCVPGILVRGKASEMLAPLLFDLSTFNGWVRCMT